MLHLTEHSRSTPLTLTVDQQQVLADVFNARFEPAPEGQVIVVPQGRVGVITVEGLQVTVHPKFPIRRLLQMMAESADPYRWLDSNVESLTSTSLHDAVAALFARACLQTFERGILRAYHREHQDLQFVRGRLRIQQYVASPHALPIPVTADVFDDDILENQILRAALSYLRGLPDLSQSSRKMVLRALRAVDHVLPLRDPLRALSKLVWTRHNQHYRSALTLAELVLGGGALAGGEAQITHAGFTVDMPRMVEQWVRTQLRTAWGLTSEQMREDWSGHLWLDDARRVRLNPDLAVRSGGQWRFVGDVKYKALRDDGAHRDDVYQMLAYLTATGLEDGVLVYVGIDGPNEVLRLPQLGRTIQVVSIDLDSHSPGATLRRFASRSALELRHAFLSL